MPETAQVHGTVDVKDWKPPGAIVGADGEMTSPTVILAVAVLL